MTAFLSRLAQRSAPAGSSVAPKGLLSRAAEPHEEEKDRAGSEREHDEHSGVKRAAEPGKKEEKEEAARSPMKESDEKKDEGKPLGRAAKKDEKEPHPDEKEEGAQAQALRRAGKKPDEAEEKEHPAAAARAAKDEEKKEAQALRRASAAKEEEEKKPEAAARAAAPPEGAGKDKDEEKKDKEAPPLSRANSRLEDPDDAPKPEETREETGPNQLTALRREPAAGAAGPSASAPSPAAFQDFASAAVPAVAAPPGADEAFHRPQVQIDRLDVIVQEPAASPASAGLDRSRAIRARYLRRI